MFFILKIAALTEEQRYRFSQVLPLAGFCSVSAHLFTLNWCFIETFTFFKFEKKIEITRAYIKNAKPERNCLGIRQILKMKFAL